MNMNPLAAAVQQMSNGLSTEQAAWQQEQSDSCPNENGDADTIGADADTVDADQQNVQTAISALRSGDVASVQSDMSAVEKDLATLKSLDASPATDSSTAAAAGTKALSDSQSAITWANQHAQSIDSQAGQTAQDASNYASSQSC